MVVFLFPLRPRGKQGPVPFSQLRLQLRQILKTGPVLTEKQVCVSVVYLLPLSESSQPPPGGSGHPKAAQAVQQHPDGAPGPLFKLLGDFIRIWGRGGNGSLPGF